VTLDFSNPTPPDEHIIENYRSTSTVRSGVEFKTAEMFRVSAGYFYNQAAAPDESVTPTLPEASRHHLSAGLGWDWGTHATLDVAYQFVQHADRQGRIVNPPPGQAPTVALNSGVYRERGNLFGFTVTVRP
jgi:long-chain fatty acid transport protein